MYFLSKRGVYNMANISWNAQSLSNYFSTSLGNQNSPYQSIYNNLSDYNLIKSGKYNKLMKAYYQKLKSDAEAETSENTDTSKKTDTSKASNDKKADTSSKTSTSKTTSSEEQKTSTTKTSSDKKASTFTTSSVIDTFI